MAAAVPVCAKPASVPDLRLKRSRSVRKMRTPFAMARSMFTKRVARTEPLSPSSTASTHCVSHRSKDGCSSEEWSSEGEHEQRHQGPAYMEDEEMHACWARALDGRTASDLSRQEIQALLAKGDMPLKYRHALWAQCTGCAGGSSSVEELQAVPKDVADQIDADVPRTQPQWLGPAERTTLRRVLRAVAAQNESTGYCQGMNNIAGTFVLLGFDEAASYKGVCTLIENICPEYHDKGLSGMRRDAQVLGSLAQRILPERTLEQLKALDVPMELLVSDHFLTLSARTWPLASTARLWDLLFTEGSPVLFASFLALLELYLNEAYAAASDEVEPIDTFRRAALRGVAEDMDTVLQHTRRIISLVPQSLIDELRSDLA